MPLSGSKQQSAGGAETHPQSEAERAGSGIGRVGLHASRQAAELGASAWSVVALDEGLSLGHQVVELIELLSLD